MPVNKESSFVSGATTLKISYLLYYKLFQNDFFSKGSCIMCLVHIRLSL